MRDLFSWVWRKPQIIWVIIPFALGTVVSTSLMKSLGDDEGSPKIAQKQVAVGSTARSDKKLKRRKTIDLEKAMGAGEQPRAKPGARETVIAPPPAKQKPVEDSTKLEKVDAPGTAQATGSGGPATTVDPKREALKADLERKTKLEGEGRQEKTQADALGEQIQQQKLVSQQLAAKLAQKVAEQERELELRRLSREKTQAELLRQQETEKLAELKRIAEENRIAKEKLISEQARIAKDQEIDRAKKIAEQERTLLAAKLKAQREDEQRAKDEKELQAAREKMAMELGKLEEEKSKAQKLRYEREKEFIMEQLKVESLKAKLAAQERTLLERDMEKSANPSTKIAPLGKSSDMANAALLKKKFDASPILLTKENVPTTAPSPRHPAKTIKAAVEPKAIVDFVNVVLRQATDKLALSFDILKTDPKKDFAEGRVVVIGKYLDKVGNSVFSSSLASEDGKPAAGEGSEGVAFKVKNVVGKKLEVIRPVTDGKLVDLWIIARDQRGNNISAHRVTNF